LIKDYCYSLFTFSNITELRNFTLMYFFLNSIRCLSAGVRFFIALCQLPIICHPYIIYILLFINNAAPKIPKKFTALCVHTSRTCLPPTLRCLFSLSTNILTKTFCLLSQILSLTTVILWYCNYFLYCVHNPIKHLKIHNF